MSRIPTVIVLVTQLAACSARTETHSEAGREFALLFCAAQERCDCADDAIILDCEARVEREFAESERKARAAGLTYDPECMATFLDYIDELGTCAMEYPEPYTTCAVYGAEKDVGEPCEIFDLMPVMYDCRIGLACIDGICRDLFNPVLPEGAVCSTEQHHVPTGWLGRCDEGLRCDSLDTRTCVPDVPEPLAALGEECSAWYLCAGDNICRPQGDDLEPSEERPGICVERTPPGEPCTLVYECDRICEDGRCQIAPPAVCEHTVRWSTLRESL